MSTVIQPNPCFTTNRVCDQITMYVDPNMPDRPFSKRDFPFQKRKRFCTYKATFRSESRLQKMPDIKDLSSFGIFVPAPKRSYRALLLDLSREIKENDLDQLKYVLRDDFGAGEIEKLTKPLHVFTAMEERELLGPGKLGSLRECFDSIRRPKLIGMIDAYEDAGTTFPLKPRADNCLEKDGYSVSIKGGRHFDTAQGEFVEVRSGSTYGISVVNRNNRRCVVNVEIDSHEMFPIRFLLDSTGTFTFERPLREKKKFKFYAIADAPAGSGINKWRNEKNGLIQVQFSPERADMKITCVASGSETQVITCSTEITDVQFLKIVSQVFGNAVATVKLNSWKPLGQRGAKLVDYGIRDGSRVSVNVGGIGGVNFKFLGCNIEKEDPSKKSEWRAGGTTLEDESDQEFFEGKAFPIDPSQAVTLNLRLVAREHEIPLPSTGNPTPLTRTTLIPPPVPN